MKRKSIALLMVATLLVGCNPTKEAEKQKSIVRSTEATERINTADLEDILHTIDHVSSVNYVGNNQLLVIADQMYLMNVSSGKLLASQKKQSINLCEWYLEGDNYYSQGVSAELYWVLNPEVNDFEIDLEAKETIHVVLPYEMVKTIENDHAWNEILGGEYGIVKDRYPDKIWLCMN